MTRRIVTGWPGWALLLALSASPTLGGEADVLEAELSPSGDGTWRLDATVQHDDTGWDHYADAFEAVTPDNEVLGTRKLLHPHVDEQPFTRSLTGLVIPDDVGEIIVRAHDSVDGYGGSEVRLTVPR